MSEQHMHYAIDVKTQNRIDIEAAIHTSSGGEYICECCGKQLNVRKGENTEHVFYHAHGECTDKWGYEFDNPWHIGMQKWLLSEIPGAETEMVVAYGGKTHRADVCIPQNKIIIELQHSPMDLETFNERIFFYTAAGYKVIWIFDKIGAFCSGDISQDENFPEWYRDQQHGRVLVSKEKSYSRLLFQKHEPIDHVFVFFQKDHIAGGSTVFDELCYGRTVSRSFKKKDGSCVSYTRTLYVTSDRVSYASELIKWLQSGEYEPIAAPQYEFKEATATLHNTVNESVDEAYEPDTDRKRPELDEARSPDTKEERLLELASWDDETGAIGKALLQNPMIKKTRALFDSVVNALKCHINYALAEAMVDILDDDNIVNYAYAWSLEHQDSCVKKIMHQDCAIT